MLQAKKGNKYISIQEADKPKYQALGFDIIEVSDKGVEKPVAEGFGKKVSSKKYIASQKENEELKKKVSDLEKALESSQKENEELKVGQNTGDAPPEGDDEKKKGK